MTVDSATKTFNREGCKLSVSLFWISSAKTIILYSVWPEKGSRTSKTVVENSVGQILVKS